MYSISLSSEFLHQLWQLETSCWHSFVRFYIKHFSSSLSAIILRKRQLNRQLSINRLDIQYAEKCQAGLDQIQYIKWLLSLTKHVEHMVTYLNSIGQYGLLGCLHCKHLAKTHKFINPTDKILYIVPIVKHNIIQQLQPYIKLLWVLGKTG